MQEYESFYFHQQHTEYFHDILKLINYFSIESAD